MKKTFTLAATMLLAMTFAFASPDKITEGNVHQKTEAEIMARVEVLTKRVEEIRSTDFTSLERAERKDLRKELKDIKKEMKTAGSTVTLSVGAAIIIVLLLIIIL